MHATTREHGFRLPAVRLISRRNRSRRRGAVTVELALVAPLIVLFLCGSIEFGRLNILRHAANNAAYEAARHGMVPGATAEEVVTYAQQHLGAVSVTGTTVDVTPTTLTEDTVEITVQVTVPVDQNSWVLSLFTGGKQVLASCTMHTERFRP